MEEYRLYCMIRGEVEHIEYYTDLGEARKSSSEWIREGQEQGIVDEIEVRIYPFGWSKPLEIWKPRRLQDDLLAERLEVVS